MSSPQDDFKHDVAFSLLDRDLELARRVGELVKQDGLSYFLYADRQPEIVGNEGVEFFTTLFRRAARIVVVFHRQGWGQTPFTAIESTAIRERGFESKGFRFALFVPLDGAPLPDWVPRTQIWFNLEKLGPELLAAAISLKAREAGSEFRPLTLAERATIAAKKLAFEQERKNFLGVDGQGVAAARQAAAELRASLEGAAAEASVAPLTLKYWQTTKVTSGQAEGVVSGNLHSVDFFFRAPVLNSLDDSRLTIQLWRGVSPLRDGWFLEAPDNLGQWTFDFDMTPDGLGWRDRESERFLPTAKLAEWMIDQLLEAASRRP